MKPFLSVLVIVASLLLVVFVKMEIRRLGYSVLKLSREKRIAVSEYRHAQIQLAKATRPDRIEKYAQTHLDLRKANKSQVIQLTRPDVVVRH